MKLILLGLLIQVAQGALPPVNPADRGSSLDLRELLSMPAENRLQVAQSRRTELLIPLEKHAFDENAEFSERWKALVLYAQLAGLKAAPVLERSLNAKDWFMRNAGLIAFREALPQQVVHVAKRLLNDKALVVRSAAIDVLQSHMDAEVRELLWSEIDQPRNYRKKQGLWTRAQILEILSREPLERELPLFVGYLQEKDTSLHEAAMGGLEKITRRKFDQPGLGLTEKRGRWLSWVKKAENPYY